MTHFLLFRYAFFQYAAGKQLSLSTGFQIFLGALFRTYLRLPKNPNVQLKVRNGMHIYLASFTICSLALFVAYYVEKLSHEEQDFAKPIVQLLCAVSALPLAPCPSLEMYQPCSTYVARNLPAAIGSKGTCPDLRLLSGHLNNPHQTSPVVKNLLEKLVATDDLKHTNPRLLLGGHGFGKSKSLFELATHRYVVLFDWGAVDRYVITLKEEINKLVLNRNIKGSKVKTSLSICR